MRTVDDYMKLLLEDPFNKSMSQIESLYNILLEYKKKRPERLEQFASHLREIQDFRDGVAEVNFDMSIDLVMAYIQEDIAKAHEDWLNSQDSVYADIDSRVDALKAQIEQENKHYNECIYRANKVDNSTFESLEAKRKELEEYSDKIFNMCNLYGVTSSDIGIDETCFTPQQLDTLYDEYLKYMQKESKGTNVISKFRTMVPSTSAQGVILLLILIFCFSPLLNVLSIAFFALLIVNQINNINRAKYYSILLAIVFNVKPENLGFVDLDTSQLVPEELTPEMMDADPRFKPLEDMYNQVDEAIQKKCPDEEGQKLINEWGAHLQENTARLNEMKTAYMRRIKILRSDTDAEIAYLQKLYDKLRSEYKSFGFRYSDKLAMDTNFVFGIHDDVIEETVDIGESNIIIRPNPDEGKMAKFLQCLMVNAMMNVMPRKVKFYIYDPNAMAKPLLPLYTNELSDYISIYSDNVSEVLDQLLTYAQETFKSMSGQTIAQYNKDCEKTGKTSMEYKVLIILSQPKKIEEDEKLNSLFEISQDGGVLIWMISDNMQSENAFVFREPFENIDNPLTSVITNDWCKKVSTAYATAIEKANPKGLPWLEFVNRVLPQDKIWTSIADKALEMYPGFKDGDPNLYKPFEIGNTGNVHVLGVGGTGAGKSVFLNHMVCTLTRQYSPKELELWLCDFKGTEFISYMRDPEHNWMLPHIKACLCTSDGDYATSLFHALRAEADLRYDIMKQPADFIGNGLDRGHIKYNPGNGNIINKKDTESWNKMWRNRASEENDPRYLENVWPRIVFICDEFQVIFEKADAKNLDSIKADITQIAKVGRAANVHIFFTSQSMNKTLSADILTQFTLRFALRCDKSVSQEILGTSKASDITEKFGYLIVKATGIKNEDQPKYKTPFFPEVNGYSKMFYDHIADMEALAIKENLPEKDVITYLESTKHFLERRDRDKNDAEATKKDLDPEKYCTKPSFKEIQKARTLEDFYDLMQKNNSLPSAGGLFVMGERMAYSANKAPDNIILTAKNNTNIMFVASGYSDYVLFFQQMMYNIKRNVVQGTIIINTQVADLAYITEAEKYITDKEKHGKLLSEKNTCKDLTNWFEKLYQARKQKGRKDTPIWIFLLGWEKGVGFGVDPDFSGRSKMNNLLQTAGEFNIHFIFMNTAMTGIAMGTINACAYKIAAKCTVDDSMAMFNTRLAGNNYDLKSGYIFVNHDGETTRDKLYISNIEHEIASSEIVV